MPDQNQINDIWGPAQVVVEIVFGLVGIWFLLRRPRLLCEIISSEALIRFDRTILERINTPRRRKKLQNTHRVIIHIMNRSSVAIDISDYEEPLCFNVEGGTIVQVLSLPGTSGKPSPILRQENETTVVLEPLFLDARERISFALTVEHYADEFDEDHLTLQGRIKRVRQIQWARENGIGVLMMLGIVLSSGVLLIVNITLLTVGLLSDGVSVLIAVAFLTLFFNIGGWLASNVPSRTYKKSSLKEQISFGTKVVLTWGAFLLTLYLTGVSIGKSFVTVFNLALYATIFLNFVAAFIRRPLIVSLSSPIYRRLVQLLRYDKFP